VLAVLGQHAGVTGVQPQRCRALSLLIEPLNLAKLVIVVLIGQQPHRVGRCGDGSWETML
jgi:hypothetical protein